MKLDLIEEADDEDLEMEIDEQVVLDNDIIEENDALCIM